MPWLSLAVPATTILPSSGCSATAVAPEDGTGPDPSCSATLPPLPKVESGLPSALKRVTTKR